MKTPTKGAALAAEAISNAWAWDVSLDHLAEIIDKETHCRELLMELANTVQWLDHLRKYNELSEEGPVAYQVNKAKSLLTKINQA